MAAADKRLTEVVRRALLVADMDGVATAIQEQFGEPVSVLGVSAHASELEPDTIHVVFEGELLSRKRGADGLYLEIEVKVSKG